MTQIADTVATIQAIDFDQLSRGANELARLILRGEWLAAKDLAIGSVAEGLVAFVPRLLTAIIAGGIAWLIYRLAYRVLERIAKRPTRVGYGATGLFLRAFRLVGLGVVGLIFLAQMGVNVTAALAGLSIAGLAIGFAAKDTLENLVAGISILIDSPFRIGDIVEVEDTYGTVSEFTLRSTRIRTPENRLLVVPNVRMINQKLLNHSALGSIRVDVPFGIAYKEDIDATRATVLETVRADSRFDPAQKPEVVVTALNESSVDMELRVFLRDAGPEMAVRAEYTEKIRKQLARAGIEIPFPHLQLFLDGAQALRDAPIRVALDASGT